MENDVRGQMSVITMPLMPLTFSLEMTEVWGKQTR